VSKGEAPLARFQFSDPIRFLGGEKLSLENAAKNSERNNNNNT